MSRNPPREARSRLTPELIDQLLDEENQSDISDISQPLSSQSDSNADDSSSDSSTPTVSRENSIGPIPIPEEEQEVREEEQEEIMVDSIVTATFDDLTGTEVRLEGQQILCFYCWDGVFYECNATIKRPADGGKPSICGPAGAINFILKVRESNQ